VILEPIESPQSQSNVNKKITENELKKIVQDLGRKTIDQVRKLSIKNTTFGRNGKIIWNCHPRRCTKCSHSF